MQHSKTQSDQRGSKTRSRPRERKIRSSGLSTAQFQPEKTIPELFASAKHKTSENKPPSPRKRRKREHSGSIDKTVRQVMEVLGPERMYDFPTMDNVVDLTGSPTPSPPKNPTPQQLPNNPAPQTGGTKKLVVKSIRRASKADPDGYFNNVWSQLDNGLSAIFRGEKISLEELYRGVENVCRQDKSPALFQKLCEKCTVQINTNLKAPLRREANDRASSVDLLRATLKAWLTWWNQLVYTSKFSCP